MFFHGFIMDIFMRSFDKLLSSPDIIKKCNPNNYLTIIPFKNKFIDTNDYNTATEAFFYKKVPIMLSMKRIRKNKNTT